MLSPFLCFIGLHDWQFITSLSVVGVEKIK
jgi:hypothetical protein